MSKTIYECAFNILKTQKEICDKLDTMGFNFEYGQGFIGETLVALINNGETIVRECLGLGHYVTVEKTCNINGLAYPISVDVLYTVEKDPDWSITEDDFCEFFYVAIKDLEVRDLMWKAMVEKDFEAKQKFNQLGHGKIGSYQSL
jgi:hypothetical protein